MYLKNQIKCFFLFFFLVKSNRRDCCGRVKTYQKQKRLGRGGKNTQKNYRKKGANDLDNHDGVVIHLEPDILECEVKWALGSIARNKMGGGDEILAELLQILEVDVIKVLNSICQQIWITQQWPQDWKRSVFIPVPKKGNDKECSNYCTTALISHASKIMVKILQARLQQYMNWELPKVQAGLRKGRGIKRSNCQHLLDHRESKAIS